MMSLNKYRYNIVSPSRIEQFRFIN